MVLSTIIMEKNKMKNLMNKTRTAENPYATFQNGNFVSHVIRAYSTKQEELSLIILNLYTHHLNL